MRERDERHALIESCSEERRQIAAMGASQVALRSSSALELNTNRSPYAVCLL